MRKAISGLIAVVTASLSLLGCPDPTTPDAVVSLSAIPGVTAPVFGSAPVSTITETAQYAGSVAWSPAVGDTFAASTVYTATITLTAKAGYTMTGVPAGFFAVEGAESDANAADSGVVTAVFPATGDGSYASAIIGVLKYVPAGRFQRDAAAANISVISRPYRMSQHEITRAQFQAIMEIDPSDPANSSGIGDPVQMTSWYHAIAFCNKLSLSEALTPVYAVSGITDWAALAYASILLAMMTGTRSPSLGTTTDTACPRRWSGCGRPWEPRLTGGEREPTPRAIRSSLREAREAAR